MLKLEEILHHLEDLGLHGRSAGVLAAAAYGVILALGVMVCLAVLFGLWCLALRGYRDRGLWKHMRTCRYAHRGLHNEERPENSMAAFRAAAEAGFGAELDVHLTRDGRLAVIHDSRLMRVCGREGRVEDLTAAELKDCRLCGTAETVPLLEEVLPLFVGKGPLIVELKPVSGNHVRLAKETCALLDRFPVDFCMESFDPRALLWLRRHRPQILRGQLVQDFFREPGEVALPLRFLLTNLLGNFLTKPDFIACKLRDRDRLAFRLCRRVWQVPEFSWTIRSPKDLETVEKQGASCIFEDFMPAETKKGGAI